jgi:hypothetical protein
LARDSIWMLSCASFLLPMDQAAMVANCRCAADHHWVQDLRFKHELLCIASQRTQVRVLVSNKKIMWTFFCIMSDLRDKDIVYRIPKWQHQGQPK